MTDGRVKSVAASVRAKLLRNMPELGEVQYRRLLRRFAIERFSIGWVVRQTARASC